MFVAKAAVITYDQGSIHKSINLMTSLAALFVSYCEPSYEPTPEEIAAQERAIAEQREREKHTIFEPRYFQAIARAEPESGAIGVKLLRDKDGVLHFMNTRVWPFHYPFCVSTFGESRTLQEFNEQVYTGKDRSMLFATIVLYPAYPIKRYYCLELNPADPMTDLELLNGFFEQVKANFLASRKVTLYFHPTSPLQIEAIKDKQVSLPVITSKKIYGGIEFRMVQPGDLPYKQMRIFGEDSNTDEELNQWLSQRTKDELIVIPRVPNDIPVVAGVICGEIIPPLCHVALLCQNRKTPCCFLKNCVSLFRAKFNEDEIISGVITKTGLYVTGEGPSVITPSEEPTQIVIQASNTSVTNLIDIQQDKQHAKDIHIVGAKAAQLENVESIYGQPIFKGTFVIPFHHYDKHVYKNNDIAGSIKAKVTQVQEKSELFSEFAHVQEAILKHAIDDELVKSVIEKIREHNMTSVIFRSSTNAEDLTGFNGAGLYESVPLQGQDVTDAQKVGEAIKKVWASVWSSKAVKERAYYKMNHNNVNMAVLVQPYIDKQMTGVKVHYNGVCITHDITRHKVKHGFVVNWYVVFAADIKIYSNVIESFPDTNLRATNFYKNQFPEQTTLMFGREENTVDVRITTTATGLSHSLITQYDAKKMVSVFGSLHTSMLNKPHKLDDTVALDIEFMVVESDKREIVVLQARPYNVNVAATEELDAKLQDLMSKIEYARMYGRRIVFYYPSDYYY